MADLCIYNMYLSYISTPSLIPQWNCQNRACLVKLITTQLDRSMYTEHSPRIVLEHSV